MYKIVLLTLILRIFYMITCGRDMIKRYPKYQYYFSITFQNFILPLLTTLFLLKRLDSKFIYICCFSYFLTDVPELIYLKDYLLIIHHVLSILLLLCANYLDESVQKYCVLHVSILELGSSILSLPNISNKKIFKQSKLPVFALSRFISLFTLYFILTSDKVSNNYKIIIVLFKFLVYIYNSQLILILYRKNKIEKNNIS